MSIDKPLTVLIAEDNSVSQNMMASILRTKSHNIVTACNGDEAIEAVKAGGIEVALVDINMEPHGGFYFAEYLQKNEINIPVVFITGDLSEDLEAKAISLGVYTTLKKPVLPARLLHIIEQIATLGDTPSIASRHIDSKGLTLRALELAAFNASEKKGRPFGALLVNQQGQIIAEGTNGYTHENVDPIAQAEIVVIQKATKSLGQHDLSDYTLFCSCEPTNLAKELIKKVGIERVFFSLSQEDISQASQSDTPKTSKTETAFSQIARTEGLKLFSLDQ